jgi:quinol monooxygenase YgiN
MVYLQISLNVSANNRPAAAAIYTQFKESFLAQAKGAMSKELLIRDEDVQVLHSFDSVENAKAYLSSDLFNQDVVTALKPLLQSPPDVRIYAAA